MKTKPTLFSGRGASGPALPRGRAESPCRSRLCRPASCHRPGLCPENVPLSGERFSPSGENSRRPREYPPSPTGRVAEGDGYRGAQLPPRKRLVVRGLVPTTTQSDCPLLAQRPIGRGEQPTEGRQPKAAGYRPTARSLSQVSPRRRRPEGRTSGGAKAARVVLVSFSLSL